MRLFAVSTAEQLVNCRNTSSTSVLHLIADNKTLHCSDAVGWMTGRMSNL